MHMRRVRLDLVTDAMVLACAKAVLLVRNHDRRTEVVSSVALVCCYPSRASNNVFALRKRGARASKNKWRLLVKAGHCASCMTGGLLYGHENCLRTYCSVLEWQRPPLHNAFVDNKNTRVSIVRTVDGVGERRPSP